MERIQIRQDSLSANIHNNFEHYLVYIIMDWFLCKKSGIMCKHTPGGGDPLVKVTGVTAVPAYRTHSVYFNL